MKSYPPQTQEGRKANAQAARATPEATFEAAWDVSDRRREGWGPETKIATVRPRKGLFPQKLLGAPCLQKQSRP